MALLVALRLLPSLSQRWRTVGANCIPIMRIRRELHRERVKVPLFSYASRLGPVAVLAFVGMVYFVVIVDALALGIPRNWLELFAEVLGSTVVLPVALFIYRHFIRTAEEVMATVSTPPIVLLRSFVDDTGHESGQRPAQTFEQLVARQIRPYGPFVAIGRPGELPQLGAARTYASHPGWQDTALALMAASRLIAVIVGATPGLRWELGQIVERGWTDKLLLLFPASIAVI
jgi:hypothetical protein